MKKEMNRIRRIMTEQNPKRITKLTRKIIEQIGGSESSKEESDEVTNARGIIIDMSIRIETIFNEMLLLFNKPKIVESSFKNKVEFLKRLITEIDKETGHEINVDRFRKLSSFVLIRNLFAHVPLNPHAEVLEFETRQPYDVYFNRRFDLRNVAKAAEEYNSLFNYIEEEINLFLNIMEKNLSKKRNKN